MFSNFPTSLTLEERDKLREIYLKDASAVKRELNSWSLLHQSKPLLFLFLTFSSIPLKNVQNLPAITYNSLRYLYIVYQMLI